MKNTVKNITIIAEDIGADNHGTGNRATAFDIIVDSSWSEEQVMSALHDIAKEYWGIRSLRLKSKKKKLFALKSLSGYHEPLNVNIV